MVDFKYVIRELKTVENMMNDQKTTPSEMVLLHLHLKSLGQSIIDIATMDWGASQKHALNILKEKVRDKAAKKRVEGK